MAEPSSAPASPPARRAWRERLLFAALIGATVVATCVGLEIYLRLTSPLQAAAGVGPEPARKGGADRLLTVRREATIRRNRHGFRGEEIVLPKPHGEVRIVLLGDSIAFDNNVAEPDIYPTGVVRRLNERGFRASVVNASANNIGIKEEVDLLEARGRAVEPDVVLLAFYLNDSRPPWGFPKEMEDKGFVRRHSVLANAVYTSIAFRRWLRAGGAEALGWVEAKDRLPWKSDRQALLELAALARYDWGAAWWPASWELVGSELDRLAALARGWNVRVAVAAFPVRYQVEADYVEDEPQRRILEEARRRGFEAFDLLPALRKGPQGLYVDQCHLTRRGHDAIATAIATELAPRLEAWGHAPAAPAGWPQM